MRVYVVSGLPRSGTSMMMRMLEAGGLPILTDRVRTADEDNPKGYFEFEPVKRLPEETAWLAEAEGKAVKIISALLDKLPCDSGRRYKLIFMRRDLDETLASQRKMLERSGNERGDQEEELRRSFILHLEEIERYLAAHTDVFEVLWVSYNRLLAEPERHARRVAEFIGVGLDVAAMASAVDASLYRNRKES